MITYRVNAARAQSNLRRYMAISRSPTLDEIDDAAWDVAKQKIMGWMGEQLAAMKADARPERSLAISEKSIGLHLVTKRIAFRKLTK